MPGAVSDSSTLIHLAKIGRLYLLFEFHKKILKAPAVWKEVVQQGHKWPGSSEVEEGRQLGRIDVVAPANRPLICFLQKDLHEGESETIALAVELNMDVVFLDESEARKTAGVYGLNISGVIRYLEIVPRGRGVRGAATAWSGPPSSSRVTPRGTPEEVVRSFALSYKI